MKKLVLSISVIIVFVLYAAFHNNSQSALPVSSNKNNSLGSTASTVNGTSVAQGAYKDGTYTGSAADAFYGTIQAQSANVDIVSGATDSSRAFTESLASA